MEYPPVKPHHKALHELQQEFVYEKYKDTFQTVWDLAGNDTFAQLEILYYYCTAYLQMGKREDAQQIIEKAHAVPTPETDGKKYKVWTLLIDANYSFYIGNTANSEILLDQAISVIEEKSDELYLLVIKLKIGCSKDTGKYEEGIRLCREILDNADTKHISIIAAAYNGLGLIYHELNKFDEATSSFLQALYLFQQLGYKRTIAGNYSNLGMVASTRAFANIGILENMSSVDLNRELLEESTQYTLAALKAISHTSDTVFMVRILCNLALSYSEQQNFSVAKKYGEQAISVAKHSNINTCIVQAILDLGRILGRAAEYAESLALLEQCLAYYDILRAEQRIALYKYLTIACDRLNLSEKGFAYAQKYLELTGSHYKAAIEGLTYHKQLLAEQTQKQENDLHQLQLRSMEEKMQAQAAQLVTQTELLSKFRDELREIVRQSASTDPTIRQIKEKLKELPCKQIDWEKFEAEFAAVHPEFTRKLNERYPTLTPMEVKLCSLLRLNLKSHEIGRLFCIAERGIETHRFNIRKKMGLEREQNLVTFLNSL